MESTEGTNSYFGDAKVKSKFVKHMKAHRKADQLIQGKTWEPTLGKKGKGCFIGCLFHKYDHSLFPDKVGAPEWLARLADTIFEGLSAEESKDFAVDVLEAIPVGVNLGPVKWRFCAFVLRENIERVLTMDIAEDLKKTVVDVVSKCLDVHERASESGVWDSRAADSAYSAACSAADSAADSAYSAACSAADSAYSAACSAADSAAYSARSAADSAAYSAYSAAYSAADSARSAAESAAWSAAESAARSAAYVRYRDELLRLLKEATRKND